MAGWSELPQDLLRLIAHSLATYTDPVQLTCVCNSWSVPAMVSLGISDLWWILDILDRNDTEEEIQVSSFDAVDDSDSMNFGEEEDSSGMASKRGVLKMINIQSLAMPSLSPAFFTSSQPCLSSVSIVAGLHTPSPRLHMCCSSVDLVIIMLEYKLGDKNMYMWETTHNRGCSSNGRALALHARGTGFNPPHLHSFSFRLYLHEVGVRSEYTLPSPDPTHGISLDNSIMSHIPSHRLDLGADIVMHSAAKFISAHSDLMEGVLVVTRERIHFVYRSCESDLIVDSFWLHHEQRLALKSRKELSGGAHNLLPEGVIIVFILYIIGRLCVAMNHKTSWNPTCLGASSKTSWKSYSSCGDESQDGFELRNSTQKSSTVGEDKQVPL
ncbi:hypothetical protein KY289_015834 [Solanum tuberosum]|nr:hypothetical protein KY289_015834 [Solanum tuberosum]KAH0700789.1 hypothetical protein KY284_015004 [Solanum tuberosum]